MLGGSCSGLQQAQWEVGLHDGICRYMQNCLQVFDSVQVPDFAAHAQLPDVTQSAKHALHLHPTH